MATPFINQTTQTKFEGNFVFDSIQYKYTLYLMPIIDEAEQNEIIDYFGNRKYNNIDLCLDIDTNTIREYLDDEMVSAFVKVQPVGVDNIASGTIQIANLCKESDSEYNDDIWINDICRISLEKPNINEGNPLNALFFLMEQLIVQTTGHDTVKLSVKNNPPENREFLERKYKSLGFNSNNEVDPTICPEWKYPKELVMSKSGLEPNIDIIDFTFLLETQEEVYSLPITTTNTSQKRKRNSTTNPKTKRKKTIKVNGGKNRKIKKKKSSRKIKK
jgi:hypothetical protein